MSGVYLLLSKLDIMPTKAIIAGASGLIGGGRSGKIRTAQPVYIQTMVLNGFQERGKAIGNYCQWYIQHNQPPVDWAI